MRRAILNPAIVLAAILGPLAGGTARPEEKVGGPLPAGRTVWKAADGPYLVVQNLEIPAESTLVIEAGTVVRFENFGLSVIGTLVARGSKAQPITFTSAFQKPSPGGWKGIQFQKSSPAAVLDNEGRYDSGSVLEHCVVEYGNGVVIFRTSPLISDCLIRHNLRAQGGGIFAAYSNSVIRRNRIEWNTSEDTGGGVRLAQGMPVLEDNVITFNHAKYSGGGISSDYGTPTFVRNIIRRNWANVGGGVATGEAGLGGTTVTGYSFSKPVLRDNTIEGNYAAGSGAGIHVNGSPTLTGNLVVNNVSGYGWTKRRGNKPHSIDTHRDDIGGGIYIRSTNGGPAVIEGNRVLHNTGVRWGGGIHIAEGYGVLRNNLIGWNEALHAGGGLCIVRKTWSYGRQKDKDNKYFEIHDNSIQQNEGGGIEVAGSGTQITAVRRCNLAGNKRFAVENRSATDFVVDRSWWGVTKPLDIQLAIWDKGDEARLGRVKNENNAAEELVLSDVPTIPAADIAWYRAKPTNLKVGNSLTEKGAAVGLSWEAPAVPGVVGYKVFFTSYTNFRMAPLQSTGLSRQGRSPIDAGAATRLRLDDLKWGQTYAFAVVGYDAKGRETGISEIVEIGLSRD